MTRAENWAAAIITPPSLPYQPLAFIRPSPPLIPMQQDIMYTGGSGGGSSSGSNRLLMFGSAGEAGAATRPKLKCPRCDSVNTKFCYYNNYNLSQPRHFCKACRRYWTKGGILRNVPVGGGSRSSPSGSKRLASSKNQRRLLHQGSTRPVGAPTELGPAAPATAPESSPTPSSPVAFQCGNINGPVMSEESSTGGADFISTSDGVDLSPNHPASAFAVDGPFMDDLMMPADLFPFGLLGGGDQFLQLPAPVDDVDELGPVHQALPEAVVVDDNSPGAVVIGKEQEELDRKEEDVAVRAIAGPAAAGTYNYVDNWHELPHLPLASDHNNLYYDSDLLAGMGDGIVGPHGIVDDLPQQQHQGQLTQLEPLTGGLLWDNSSYYCHQWGGIEIDQSLLDLL